MTFAGLSSLSSLSSIEERMQKVYARICVETATGVPARDKEHFVPLCQQHEAAHLPEEEQALSLEKEAGFQEMTWKDFDNWHDSPIHIF